MGQAQHKNRAVLIVEDDAEVRSLVATLLEDEQLNVIECESAEAALAIMLIGGREVTMILADVRLPGAMDGVDLAWEVKLRWPLLPVILTSGQRLYAVLIQGLQFNFAPYGEYAIGETGRCGILVIRGVSPMLREYCRMSSSASLAPKKAGSRYRSI